MRRHGRGTARDHSPDLFERASGLTLAQAVRHGIVTRGADLLARQDRLPALDREQLAVVAQDAAVAAEELEALAQAVGKLHVAALPPELPGALRQAIVRDQEVARPLVIEGKLPVVAVDVGRPEMAVGEERQQEKDAALDQMDAGGLERLEESRRQADGDAVLVPAEPAPPGRELQAQRIAQRPSLEAREEDVLRRIILQEPAAVDVS